MKKFKYTVFSTNDNYYLYDGVSGNIFNIKDSIHNNHKELFECLENENIPTNENLISDYKEILEAVKIETMGKINTSSPCEYWFNIDDYKANFNKELKHLMIGITEKCNLRCKYCIYGGSYNTERTHNELNIKLETLKESIDIFFTTSKSDKKVINLYGGEPFVNFKGISYIVDYINKIDSNTQIYITTNGVLLKKDIMKWFSTNKNVHLFVSFAGIPSMHDELRLTVGGKPTYEVIKKNLLYLKDIDPTSYSTRINFIFNIFDEIQLPELQDYWAKDELFEHVDRMPEVTFIDCFDNDYIYGLREEILKKYDKRINPLLMYIELLKNGEHDNLIVKHYDEKLLRVHRSYTGNRNILTGVCRPFASKIFIDANGKLNLCENFTYGDKLGTIKDGISYDITKELLRSYKSERNKTCVNCWASKFCSLCYRDLFDREGAINTLRSSKICKYEQKAIKIAITEYCTVMEHGEDLLDHLNGYVVHV